MIQNICVFHVDTVLVASTQKNTYGLSIWLVLKQTGSKHSLTLSNAELIKSVVYL